MCDPTLWTAIGSYVVAPIMTVLVIIVIFWKIL